jgi:hypothetical protein
MVPSLLPFIMAGYDRNFMFPIRRQHSQRMEIMRTTFPARQVFLAALCAAFSAGPALAASSQEVPSYQPYYYAPSEQNRTPVAVPDAAAPSIEVYPTAMAPQPPAQPQLQVQPQTVPTTVSNPVPVPAVAPNTVRNLNDELPPAMKTPSAVPAPTSIYAPAQSSSAAPPALDVISTANMENEAATPPPLPSPSAPPALMPMAAPVPPVPLPAEATAPVPPTPPMPTVAAKPAPLTNFNASPQNPVTLDQLPSYQNTPAYDQHRTWTTPRAVDKKSDDQSSSSFLNTPSGVDVGVLVEGYHYQEPDAGGTSVNLNGIKYGLDVALTTHFDKEFFGTAEIEYARGLSNYKGSGETDNHLEQLWDVRALFGDDLTSKTSAFGTALYTGLGYRQLYSNDQGAAIVGNTEFLGYRRENQMVYLPLGMKPRFALGDDSRLEMTLEGDVLLRGIQTSWLGDTGLGDPTIHNKQDAGSGYGIRAGFMWETRHWAFGPYLNYWNIDASNAKIFASPNSSCGGTVCVGTEPTNHTVEYGIQGKYHFDAF